ncbi:putative ATP synthase f chain mitochondrial precursor, partial [Nadsonia fulvescens var. elongata DSM 6958]
MSFIIRRQLSTLIPPKVASPANLSASPNAQRINKVLDFYKGLPKKSDPAPAPYFGNTPAQRYYDKYREAGSGKTLLHIIAGGLALYYTIDYKVHLRHHK